MYDDLKPSDPSGYYIFGTDIFSIPCFRTSLLTGMMTLTGTSLLTFLFTSNSKKAFNYAFGAFAVVTFPYMMYCQNEHYDKLSKMREIQDRIKQQTKEDYVMVDTLSSTSRVDEVAPEALV